MIEYSVEYAGEPIGVLPSNSIPQPEEAILLAGRRWQVQAVCHGQHRISVVPAQGKNPPRFSGLAGQIDPRVMHKMREILAGETTYSYLNPKAAEMLAAARAVFARLGLAVQNFITTRSSTVWFPWAGTRTHEALSVLAALENIRVRKDLISLTYDNCPQDRFKEHCGTVASGGLTLGDLNHGGIQMERDRFDQYVPKELLAKSFASEWLDLGAARELADALVDSCAPDQSTAR